MSSFKTILLISLIGLFHFSSLVNGKKEAKKKCEAPIHFAYNLDYDWVMGHSAWYFPLLSRQDLLRVSSDILEKKVEDIRDEDLSKACIKATWDGLAPVISGFEGKRTTYNLSPNDFTNFNILGFEKTWTKGKAGTLYITHTDNKNFVFFMRCWEDGERTWSVMTTTQKPSEEVIKKIRKHVKLLKFTEDDMVKMNYDECGVKKSEL